MTLREEIFEQPEVLRQTLEKRWQPVMDVAELVRQRNPRYVFLAARGTSDHAGLYAKYLWGAYNDLPMALAAPSLFSLYEQPPRLDDALVVGVSQSGKSPDIVGVLEEGRRQGALTLAITNTPGSPLADAADSVLDIAAGPERAVAATKTYTAQLLIIAMLAVALKGDEERRQELGRVPEWVAEALKLDDQVAHAAPRYRYMRHCVVLGRGYNYATAFELALKLKELTYVVTEPYSSADFRHGPIAIVDPGFPILSVVHSGALQADMLDLLRELNEERDAELLVISDLDAALELARVPLSLPSGIPEWLSPLVSIIPGQLLAYHITQVKGYDTEKPRGLNKVTLTH